MKRILALIMTLVMVLSLCSVTAYADTALTMNVSPKTDLKANDIVKVSVSLPALSEKISGWQMVVNYPSDKLEYVSYETVYDEDAEADVISTEMPSAFSVTVQSPATAASGKIKAIADCLNNRTISSTVRLFTLNFKVKSGAYGDGSFSVSDLEVIQNNADGSNRTLTGISVPAAQSVTIPKPPVPATKITLNQTSLNLDTKSADVQLTAALTPADSTDTVTWTSSNTSVVTVSAAGLVHVVGAGDAVITARANATVKAECTVHVASCNHTGPRKQVAKKAATCTADGENAHWVCENCGAKFMGEHDTTIATADQLRIPALGHDFTKEVKSDAALKTAGDCMHNAVYYKSCSRCTAIATDADNATFTGDKDANKHTGNNTYASIGNGKHKVTCECGVVIQAEEACSGGTATCKDQPICEKCGVKYGTTTPHTYANEKYIYVKTVGNIAIEQLVCDVCDTPAAGQDARYRAYIDLDMVLNVKKDAGSTYDVPAGVVFTYTMTGKDSHAFAATRGGDETINHTHLFIGEDATEAGAISKLTALLKGDTWTVKQTSAGGNGWTVDATEYTVTFDVNEQTNEVKTVITKKVTKTVTTKDAATGKDVTNTVETTEPATAIEFTNTYKSTTKYEPNPLKPAGGSTDTKKDNGKTVKSGKTFDAGIALYVGLSVLSVTGGALVIGKKKEF